MNFISEARKEILDSISLEGCCVNAFLFGIYKGSGYIALRDKQWWIAFRFTDTDLLYKCSDLIKELTNTDPTITAETGYGGRNSYQSFNLDLDPGQSKTISQLLSIDFQGVSDFDKQIDLDKYTSECCRKALLKGIFLSTGTMSLPNDNTEQSTKKKSGGYYLEMKVFSEQLALDISKLLKIFGIQSKIRKRKMSFSVYLKDSELISDFLAATGAYNTLFKLQDFIMLRSMKNDSNRGLNCNVANINRAVGAAINQCKAIRTIEETIGLDSLDPELRRTALTRIENPELTLSEIAELLGNLSKSCINHRLRKLVKLADSIEMNNIINKN